MDKFGDLSKAQRQLLDRLYTAVPPAGERAVTIDTALSVAGKAIQTVRNLHARDLVEFEIMHFGLSCKVWLSLNGIDMMRDVSQVRSSGRYLCRHHGLGVGAAPLR
ncbi:MULTISPECIES: hypothetical protein [unclassified Pseudoxanthomonas]|uniref:hypothetical protein n=1 Tax=unclassified Pseudoxanthomonas TaxID=2645906 RepID=UPI00307D92E0